jgi:hypothetical protein
MTLFAQNLFRNELHKWRQLLLNHSVYSNYREVNRYDVTCLHRFWYFLPWYRMMINLSTESLHKHKKEANVDGFMNNKTTWYARNRRIEKNLATHKDLI